MKKIIFTVILLTTFLTSTAIFAQNLPFEKGNKIISGGFSFSLNNGDAYKVNGHSTTTLHLNTSYTQFIKDRFGIGGKFILESFKGSGTSSNTWGLGPQITYFFNIKQNYSQNSGSIFPYSSIGYIFKRCNSPLILSNLLNFSGGSTYMLNDNVGVFGEVNFELGFITRDDYNDVGEEISTTDSGSKIILNIGLIFFL